MPLETLASRVRMLTVYATVSTLLLIAVVALAATSERRAAFDEIDVERINVRKPDGSLSLVISNEARMPGVISGGREYGPKKGRSGLVFYDGAGDEMGGLTFGSRVEDGVLTHSGHLAFDARGNDQAVNLSYAETWEGGEQTSRVGGLRFVDRAPSTPDEGRTRLEMSEWSRTGTAAERERAAEWFEENGRYGRDWSNRIVIGSVDGTAYLGLNDGQARERIRATVSEAGAPRVEVLDADGAVVHVVALDS